jgi:hypothetical protein
MVSISIAELKRWDGTGDQLELEDELEDELGCGLVGLSRGKLIGALEDTHEDELNALT